MSLSFDAYKQKKRVARKRNLANRKLRKLEGLDPFPVEGKTLCHLFEVEVFDSNHGGWCSEPDEIETHMYTRKLYFPVSEIVDYDPNKIHGHRYARGCHQGSGYCGCGREKTIKYIGKVNRRSDLCDHIITNGSMKIEEYITRMA